MRHLNKTVWPYKIKVEDFNQDAHCGFIVSHPNIKTLAILRNSHWIDYTMYYDVYFQKESDLIFYKLCV
jgi:hypothetical protein